MVRYMDQNGNIATIIECFMLAETVEIRVNESNESEYLTWTAFIKRFNSIAR